MSTPTYNKRDIQRILKNNGFVFHHQKGGRRVYRNEKNEHITIAICKCNKMIMQRLIKEYHLIVD